MQLPPAAERQEFPARAVDEVLRVRLLGGFDLRRGDQAVVIESQRARSLLGFLVLNPGVAHPRQQLAFMLWPDSTEGQARTNLRKVLHLLRREVPELERRVEATASMLRWRSDLPQKIDVAAFEAALAEAERDPAGSADAESALRRAVTLYRGDLLAGCYDEWVAEPRERLRDRYVAALRRLVTLLVENGDDADAIRFGRDLVRADALREDSYRLLIQAHEAGGDLAGAVRVYHECVSTLQRELGVEPSAETTAVYTALANRGGGVATEVPVARPSRLVGRDGPWSRLVAAWLGTESGLPTSVLVTGEAGIGKTRLVDELAVWCTHRGALVAQARSYPTEGELAYGVVAAWVRSDAFGSLLDRAGPTELRELASLVPELDARAPEATAIDATDASEARRRLFDAVACLVRSAGRPVLLVADDAAWCDGPTLQLVHYLLRLEPPLPLLVVATARREELDAGQLGAVAADLELVDRAVEVRLDRLSPAETEALARDLAGRDVGSEEAAALLEETEGNPLFVVELVRAGWLDSTDRSGRLPRKLHALIEARLSRLAAPTREVLGLVATVGRAFTTGLLRAASAADDAALAGALDELWRRGVIQEQAGDAYDFTHGKLREVAYAGLSPPARRGNHLAVAEALQRLHGGEVDAVSGRVAVHYEAAGRAKDAIAWYLRAARHGQRLYADAEAVDLFQRARALLGEVPPAQRGPLELQLLTALPAALVGVDGFASERLGEVQQRALELAGRLGVEPDPVLLRSLVMSRLCARDFDGACEAALRLSRAAAQAGDEPLAVEGDYLLGITAFWDGRLHDAREHFERVVGRFDPARRGEHLVRFGHDPVVVCLSRLANALFFLGDDNKARRTRDEAVALARHVGHPYSRDAAYGFAMLVSIDLADVDAVRGYLEAIPSEQHVSRPTALLLEAGPAYLDVLAGNVEEGIRSIREAIAAAGEIDLAPGWHACLQRVLVAAHEAAGDPISGTAVVDEALAATGSRLWEPEIRRVGASFLAAAGRPSDEVAAELAAAEAVATRQGSAGLVRRVAETRSRLGMA